MNYLYLVAWKVSGGTSLWDGEDIELYEDENCRCLFTKSPNSHLTSVDRGRAIRENILGGHWDEETLKIHIEKIQESRHETSNGQLFLIYEGKGEIECTITAPSRTFSNFIVAFDAISPMPLKSEHDRILNSIRTALIIEGRHAPVFEKIAEEVFVRTEDGKEIHSINCTAFGEISVLSSLTSDNIRNIRSRIRTIYASSELKSVTRLVTQYVDSKDNKLRSFISSWSALEILLGKIYRKENLDANETKSEGKFPEPYVMARFKFVRDFLFPMASEKEHAEDALVFNRIKKIRDNLVHGKDVSDRSLPIHETVGLTVKYLSAYLSNDPSDTKQPHA